MEDWRDPEFEAQMGERNHRPGFARWLDFDLIGAGNGRCVIEVPFREDMKQRQGFCHGGIVGALADSVAVIAAATVVGDAVTQNYTIQYVFPTTGPIIRAEGNVIKAGRRIVSSEARIWSFEEGKEPRLNAIMLASIATLGQAKPDSK